MCKGSIVALGQQTNISGVRGISIGVFVSGELLLLASNDGCTAPLWPMAIVSSLCVGSKVTMYGFERLADANATCTRLVEIGSDCTDVPSFEDLAASAVDFDTAWPHGLTAYPRGATADPPSAAVPRQIAAVKGSIGHISLPAVSANLGMCCGRVLHAVPVVSTAIRGVCTDDGSVIQQLLNVPLLLILGLTRHGDTCSVFYLGIRTHTAQLNRGDSTVSMYE
jgi:hypothetical protein